MFMSATVDLVEQQIWFLQIYFQFFLKVENIFIE